MTTGHQEHDKLQRKPYKQPLANFTELEVLSKDISDISLSAVVSEVKLVGSNPKEWWVDMELFDAYAETRRCSLPSTRSQKTGSWSWATW